MSLRDILLAITVSLLWGVNFVATKIGLIHFPPLFFMGLRFLLVAAVLLPFVGKPALPLRTNYLLSLTYGVAYQGLLFTGVWMGLDVSTSIIAIQLNVPFTLLLSIFFLQDKIGWRRISGMVIAFSGIVLVIGSPDVMHTPAAFLLVVAAAACWAIFNIQLKKLGPLPSMNFLCWVSVLAVPQFFLLSWMFETNQIPALMHITWQDIVALLYTALLSTTCGFWMWTYLLKHHSVNQVAPFSMLMPFFGVISAVFLLQEQLTWLVVIGGLVTLTGVAIITLRRPKIVTSEAI